MGETIDYERVKQTDAGIKRMQIMQSNPKFETEEEEDLSSSSSFFFSFSTTILEELVLWAS